MRATVFIASEGEPVRAPDAADIADYDIVSAQSLRVAVWALQAVASTSACPGSRRTAEQALRAIALNGDVETSPAGVPMPVKLERHELDGDRLGNCWDYPTTT